MKSGTLAIYPYLSGNRNSYGQSQAPNKISESDRFRHPARCLTSLLKPPTGVLVQYGAAQRLPENSNLSCQLQKYMQNGAMDCRLFKPPGRKIFLFPARFNADSLKSLLAFKSDYPSANAYSLYGGSRCLFERGVHIIPYSVFVKELPQLLANKIK